MEKQKLKLTSEELLNIISGDDDNYEIVEKQITGEWRHGNENSAVVKRISDGKYFELDYRTSCKESCDFQDMNSGGEYEEITYVETVTIPKSKYDSLIKDADFMRALEAAGVDNWEGYNVAIDILEESR